MEERNVLLVIHKNKYASNSHCVIAVISVRVITFKKNNSRVNGS